VNAAGDVAWVAWPDATEPNPTGARIRYSSVASGVATAPITLAYTGNQGEGGQRMRISSDSDRIVFRDGPNDGSLIEVYDLGTMGATPVGQYNIFTTDGDQKAYHNGFSDDGNWDVTNMRSVAAGGTLSDLVLIDITNINAPVQTYLTGDGSGGAAPTVTRNDPSMDLIDADTAIVVWDEGGAIKGMYVSGLSVNAPVAGPQFNIADGPGLQYADVDYDSTVGAPLVAWMNGAGVQQYRYLPEPASLSLLALGGLALLRRR